MIEAFKYYKRKDKPIDWSSVIDCSNKDNDELEVINLDSSIAQLGLLPPNKWQAFKIKKCQGLIIIKNPFSSIAQRYWIRKLLEEFTKGNKNNLQPSRFKQNVIEDFWKAYNDEQDEKQKKLLKKSYRWTTLGYNYDWNNKIYDENDKREFPHNLSQLMNLFAKVLNFDFKSEAAIVNFYPLGTTLAAHTDHSEHCNSPLLSLSFGQSAIFLIGGKTKDEEPLPILLESGDALIMSGESRWAFHAVPRVFREEKKEPWNSNLADLSLCNDLDQLVLNECQNNEKWQNFDEYLKDSRINVNVRQVNS